MAIKNRFPEVAFSSYKVAPDEIDRYEVVTFDFPTTDASWFGTAAGTQTTTPTYGVINKIAGWPRNLRVIVSCATGSVAGGTSTFTGKNQFGVSQTETIKIVSAANGGTTEGTKVFAEVSSASVAMGTGNAGVGTVKVGGGLLGTTALFGLPVKVGGTTDLRLLSWKSNGTAVSVNGGTIGSFIDATQHAIKAVATVDGTTAFTAWIKPTYDSSAEADQSSY